LPAATVVEVWTSKARINGGSIEEVREHLVDLGVLLPVVAFDILFGIPEAERKNTLRIWEKKEDVYRWQ
jgi:hypothetical protein